MAKISYEEYAALPPDDAIGMLRSQGEADFFFFAKNVCEFGENATSDGPRITEDQHGLCDFLQAVYERNIPKIQAYVFKSYSDEQKKKLGITRTEDITVDDTDTLILCPRDTLKSTVLQAFALWITRKNPDVRILFYGEVHEQAQKRLAVVKRVIEHCETFRDCYGDLDGSRLKYPWNENIAVLADRKNKSIREATFECAGLDVVINARHFDWIFPDDLHSESNTKSKDQIASVEDKVGKLIPLLGKGARRVFAGVFWNDSDYHTKMVDTGSCNVFKRSCWMDEKKTESAYPNTFTVKILKSKKSKMSDADFSCHYELNPISSATQRFPKVRFPIVPAASFLTQRTYLLIDPAGDPTSENEEKKDSDYYAMEVWKLNDRGQFLLADGIMEICDPTAATEFALGLTLKHPPFVIGIERAGMGNLKHYLQEAIRKAGMFAIIQDLKPNGRSKLQRVEGWEPYVRQQRVMIAEDCPIKDEFLEQLSKVTAYGIKAKKDDLIDPFGYLMDLIRDYGLPQQQEEDEDVVPPEYAQLNQLSRDYWMRYRKKERESVSAMGEFCV